MSRIIKSPVPDGFWHLSGRTGQADKAQEPDTACKANHQWMSLYYVSICSVTQPTPHHYGPIPAYIHREYRILQAVYSSSTLGLAECPCLNRTLTRSWSWSKRSISSSSLSTIRRDWTNEALEGQDPCCTAEDLLLWWDFTSTTRPFNGGEAGEQPNSHEPAKVVVGC